MLISFFMSLMFPTIYGLSLDGIAKSEHPDDAKLGASGGGYLALVVKDAKAFAQERKEAIEIHIRRQ